MVMVRFMAGMKHIKIHQNVSCNKGKFNHFLLLCQITGMYLSARTMILPFMFAEKPRICLLHGYGVDQT